MEKERLVTVIDFNGIEITQLTIDEMAALIKAHQEMNGTSRDEFMELVNKNKRSEIKGELLEIIKPVNDMGNQKSLKNLYEKLKNITNDQAVEIRASLYMAQDTFIPMFRLDNKEDMDKVHNKSNLSN